MENSEPDKIHILFVMDGMEFGGGERCFAQVISDLPEDRYEIYLASSDNRHLYNAIHTARVHRIPLDFSSKYNPALLTAISKVIKEKEIDIVHGQGARAEFYARVAVWLTGTSKYVSTIAMPVEGFDIDPLRKRVYLFFDRLSDKFVDHFIVVSESLKRTLIEKRCIAPEKVTKIYNGIETSRYTPDGAHAVDLKVRAELGVNESTFVIGAIGRMVWQKGFECLIRGVNDLLNHTGDIKILMVGDGPLKEKLQELVGTLGIGDHVIFTGFRSDVREILCAIDVLVIPSLAEGFPMVTIEAMAMAKPIIATRIDGITEQISDGKEGLLVPPNDSSALAEAIIKLMRDRELARSLGLAARKKVESEFSVEKMIAETEKVYQSLLT